MNVMPAREEAECILIPYGSSTFRQAWVECRHILPLNTMRLHQGAMFRECVRSSGHSWNDDQIDRIPGVDGRCFSRDLAYSLQRFFFAVMKGFAG